MFFLRLSILLCTLFNFSYLANGQNIESTCPTGSCTQTFRTEAILPESVFLNCDSIRPQKLNPKSFIFRWEAPDGTVYRTLNMKPKGAGNYKFCYDTLGAPSQGSCPKTKMVTVTQEIRPRFAVADPRDTVHVCVGSEHWIGTPGDSRYRYKWDDDYKKNYQQVGLGNKFDSSSLHILVLQKALNTFVTNNTSDNSSKRIYVEVGINLGITVTDKQTGCRDKDTMLLYVAQPPAIKVIGADSQYCVGDAPNITFYTYFVSRNYDKFKVNFLVDSVPQNLPAFSISNTSYPANFDLNWKNVPLSSATYKVTLPPGTNGKQNLSFRVKADTPGCSATMDTSITFSGGSSDIKVKGFDTKIFCGDKNESIPLSATTSAGAEAKSGTFNVSPATKALTGDRSSGYFFNPALADSGTYYIVYKEEKVGKECGVTGADTITILPLPKPDIRGRSSVCEGAMNAEYKDVAFAGFPIIRQWRVTNGVPTPGSKLDSNSININYNNSKGEAVIELKTEYRSNGNTCYSSDTLYVKISNILNSNKPVGDTLACAGTKFITYSTDPGKNYFHKWSVLGGTFDPKYLNYDTSTQVVVNWLPNQPEYWLVVKDSSNNSCFGSSDTLKVVFGADPYAKILTPDTTICEQDVLLLQADPKGGTSFTWTTGSGKVLPIKEPSIKITGPFEEKYILTVGKGKETTCPLKKETINITSLKAPSQPLSQQEFPICFENSPDTIHARRDNLSNKILWNNELFDTLFIPKEKGKYTVVQVNENGCKSKPFDFTVTEACPPKIFLPEAFSPNGDAINDSLKVFGNTLQNFLFTIYNRWGEVVFTSRDRNSSWDGKHNGLEAPVGIYAWVITVDNIISETQKVKVTKKGSVALIR